MESEAAVVMILVKAEGRDTQSLFLDLTVNMYRVLGRRSVTRGKVDNTSNSLF